MSFYNSLNSIIANTTNSTNSTNENLETLKQRILSCVNPKDRAAFEKKFEELKQQEINILVLGPTGAGKSSTINAIFDTKKAEVGYGVDPETKDFECYKLENLVIWDTPGFGDGVDNDKRYAKLVYNKLQERKGENALIDVVLIIVDGSNRDMGTTYKIINDYVLKVISHEQRDRVIVAINQADVAMKGRGWDYEANKPKPELEKFLEEKVRSIHDRVLESTGVDITPIYYSAGGTDENGEQMRPYNINKLLRFVISCTPVEKRPIFIPVITPDEEDDDDNSITDILVSSVKRVFDSACEFVSDCYDTVKSFFS